PPRPPHDKATGARHVSRGKLRDQGELPLETAGGGVMGDAHPPNRRTGAPLASLAACEELIRRSRRMVQFNINGRDQTVEVDGDMPLLWVLRDTLGLTGTKFGCGIAQCGACTVHVNGQAVRSCTTPASTVEGATIVTIEGLS